MKINYFILLFILISYSTTDTCTDAYLTALQTNCPSTLSTNKYCFYSEQKCLSLMECSEGDKNHCEETFPQNFLQKKCILDSAGNACTEEQRKCSDYSTSTQITVDGIKFNLKCNDLQKETDSDRCDSNTNGGCSNYKNTCTDLEGSACTNNIPFDSTNRYSKKCDLKDENGETSSTCNLLQRSCDDQYLLNYRKDEMKNEEFCQKLKATDTTNGKSCHSNGEKCVNNYRKCEDFTGENSAENCLTIKPLYADDGYPFDENIYKCVPNNDGKCKSEKKKCNEYKKSLNNPQLCEQLEAETANKGCVYDKSYESNNCKEEYLTCDNYFEDTSTGEKNRAKCEGFKPHGSDKNCYWEKTNSEDEEGTCTEAYTSCVQFNNYFTKEYEEKDKKKCVSIGDGNQCVLDKDKTCTTRTITCEEATNIEECEKVTGANKPVVSDPTKKYCKFIIGKGCIENYKYCSDYRPIGVDEGTAKEVCERILPYDSDGNEVEDDYECIYDTSIGCQRKKKPCTKAKSSTQCTSLCTTLTAGDNQYYAYTGGKCVLHYKLCSNAPTNPATKCTNNIPQSNGQCEVSSSDSTICQDKIVDSTPVTVTCSSLINEDVKKSTCEGISDTCFYSSNLGCTKLDSCSQYLKRDFPDLDEKFCNQFEVGINKICSLKSDGSGCVEKDKEPICPIQNNQTPQNQQNYGSELRIYEMKLIIALLSLLI